MSEHRQPSRSVKFDCPKCKQHYEAPEDMADSPLECQVCKESFRIPRPRIGYYADPSETQREEAELHSIQVLSGMFRGQLKELMEKANHSGKHPTQEQYKRFYIRQSNRRIRVAQEAIDAIEHKLTDPTITPSAKKSLDADLKNARKKKIDVMRDEAESKTERERDDREYARQDARQEKEFGDMERLAFRSHMKSFYYDWDDKYRKPSAKQSDAIFEWLQANGDSTESDDIHHAIKTIFPELIK